MYIYEATILQVVVIGLTTIQSTFTSNSRGMFGPGLAGCCQASEIVWLNEMGGSKRIVAERLRTRDTNELLMGSSCCVQDPYFRSAIIALSRRRCMRIGEPPQFTITAIFNQ